MIHLKLLKNMSVLYNMCLLLIYFFYLKIIYLLFVFLGLHLWHMEVPRLGVESEL